MGLRNQQLVTQIWRDKNFPGSGWEDQLIGMMEELGELSHALLKQKQKIRGEEEKHEADAKDAVGDLLIYLMGLCSVRDWDVEEILNDTVDQVLGRDWQANPQDGS